MSLFSVEVIPHNEQRYETPGDWIVYPSGDIAVFVSDLGNWKYHALMGIHELSEALICREMGITQEQVDAFDKDFEVARANGAHAVGAEPGAQPDAPYRVAHFIAETIERVLAVALGVNWDDYGFRVEALGK